MEQLATRTQVNEHGQPELWLHDGSRKLTPEELAWLSRVTEAGQDENKWQQALANATTLEGLVRFSWDDAEQRYKPYRYVGETSKKRYLTESEFEAARQYILTKRAQPGSGFVIGGTAP